MTGNKFRMGLRPSNSFEDGHAPWNRGARGIHLSPDTEFKQGRESSTKAPLGTVRVRTDKNGRPRAWLKVAQPKVWRLRAVVVWESINGPVPSSQIVHHLNRQTLDDRPENLALQTRAEHLNEHRGELLAARKTNPSEPIVS